MSLDVVLNILIPSIVLIVILAVFFTCLNLCDHKYRKEKDIDVFTDGDSMPSKKYSVYVCTKCLKTKKVHY